MVQAVHCRVYPIVSGNPLDVNCMVGCQVERQQPVQPRNHCVAMSCGTTVIHCPALPCPVLPLPALSPCISICLPACLPAWQIFVGGLDPSVSDDQLRQVFSAYGEILYVKIPFGKGCGFVQFGNR